MERQDDGQMEWMRRQVRESVADGVRDAIGDPALMEHFWTSAFTAMQKHAAREAGRVVLVGLGGMAKRSVAFIVLGLIVYKLGGWSAVAALWKAVYP